jgi:hypothetical protein
LPIAGQGKEGVGVIGSGINVGGMIGVIIGAP